MHSISETAALRTFRCIHAMCGLQLPSVYMHARVCLCVCVSVCLSGWMDGYIVYDRFRVLVCLSVNACSHSNIVSVYIESIERSLIFSFTMP